MDETNETNEGGERVPSDDLMPADDLAVGGTQPAGAGDDAAEAGQE